MPIFSISVIITYVCVNPLRFTVVFTVSDMFQSYLRLCISSSLTVSINLCVFWDLKYSESFLLSHTRPGCDPWRLSEPGRVIIVSVLHLSGPGNNTGQFNWTSCFLIKLLALPVAKGARVLVTHATLCHLVIDFIWHDFKWHYIIIIK